MRSSIVFVGLLAASACQSEDEQDAGVISLAIAAAPAGASCLRVNVEGDSGTTARSLKLTPGSPTTGTLAGLPLGPVEVSAAAFGVSCSAVNQDSIPSWVSAPVSVVLTPGTPVAVNLVMQKAGQISVSVDWNTGGAGGSGGSGGTSGASGSGGSGGLLDVAQALNGQMLRAPCLQDVEANVCRTSTAACPPTLPSDPALGGVLLTDKTFTLGGTPGTPYTVTLHVQGEVEAKRYTGAADQNNTLTSPKADGFTVGGTPTGADAYSVYLIRVTNPDGAKKDYFLNSLVGPGVSDHTTYGMDYTASIQAQGGATIRLVAADPNCSMIKNCGPMEDQAGLCAAPIVLQNIDPVARSSNPSFDFNRPYNGQWVSLVVTRVTSP